MGTNMTETTNARKVYETGGSWVVALPKDWARDHGIKPGDQFAFERTDSGFTAVKVEFRTASDV